MPQSCDIFVQATKLNPETALASIWPSLFQGNKVMYSTFIDEPICRFLYVAMHNATIHKNKTKLHITVCTSTYINSVTYMKHGWCTVEYKKITQEK